MMKPSLFEFKHDKEKIDFGKGTAYYSKTLSYATEVITVTVPSTIRPLFEAAVSVACSLHACWTYDDM